MNAEQIRAALRKRYNDTRRYAIAEEVGLTTGFSLQDNADREVLVGILNDHISYAASVCGYTRKARIPEKGGA